MCSCDERNHTFGGRSGGIAVGPDGAVFVSSPSSGNIWRMDARDVSDGTVLPGGARVDEHGMTPRSPAGLAVDESGTLAVADSTGHRVWAIMPTGACTVVAGSTYGHRDGPAGEALFRYPSDVAIGPDGTWYVADTENNSVRRRPRRGAAAGHLPRPAGNGAMTGGRSRGGPTAGRHQRPPFRLPGLQAVPP